MKKPISKARAATLGLALALAASTTLAAPLTPGNLVVLQLGDGNTSVSGSAVPIVLNEITIGGVLVQPIAVPSTAAGNRLTVTGSSGSSGHLSVSVNRQYLTFGGFDLPAGTLAASGTTTASRVIGRLAMDGTLDLTTYVGINSGTTFGFSGGDNRSVVSHDGTAFWAAGNSTGGGIRYVPYANPASTTSTLVSGTPSNDRVAVIYNGQLYMSSASSPNVGINQVGTGLPTTTGNAATLLMIDNSPMPAGPSPYGFAFSSPTRVFVADDRAIGFGGGLGEYNFSGSAWSFTTKHTTGLTTGLKGVALGTYNGAPTHYVTDSTGNLLRVDATTPGTFTLIASPPANALYRGVVQVPSALPAAASAEWSKIQ